MLYQWFIGIDVSKATLDVTLMDNTGRILLEEQIKNTKTALSKFLRTLKRKHDGQKLFLSFLDQPDYGKRYEEEEDAITDDPSSDDLQESMSS